MPTNRQRQILEDARATLSRQPEPVGLTNKQRRIIEDARATLERRPDPPPVEPTDEQRRILERHPPTDEQRLILEAARATLNRQPEPFPEPAPLAPPVAEPVRYKTHFDTTPPASPQPQTPAPADWAGYIEQRIEQERAFMIAVVGEALGEALVTARADYKKTHRKTVAELTLEITKLKCVCDELRIALGAERRGTVLDLPTLPRRSDLN